MDEEWVSRIVFLAVLAAVTWFFYPGSYVGSDRVTAYMLTSENCLTSNICNIRTPGAIFSVEYRVNEAGSEIVQVSIDGEQRLKRFQPCTIADKWNWTCENGPKMMDGKATNIFSRGAAESPFFHPVSGYQWRTNWLLSMFTQTAATDWGSPKE